MQIDSRAKVLHISISPFTFEMTRDSTRRMLRGACEVVATGSGLIAVVVLLNRFIPSFRFGSGAAPLALSAFVFLLLASAITIEKLPGLRGLQRTVRLRGVHFVGGGVVYACIGLLMSRSSTALVLSTASAAIFFSAFVEEIIFRVALPASFLRQFASVEIRGARAVVLSWLLAQLVFALCHGFPEALRFSAYDFSEVLRLVVAGLLYGVLVSRCGLWLGTAVHAALNFNLHFLASFPAPVVGSVELVMGMLLALQILRTDAPGGSRQSSQKGFSTTPISLERCHDSPA